ncbi:hypothetical protein COP2_044865 [Malus domestica]
MFFEGIAIKSFLLDGLHRPRVTWFPRFSFRDRGLHPLRLAWYFLTFLSVGKNVPKEQSMLSTTSIKCSTRFKPAETLQASQVITTLPVVLISQTSPSPPWGYVPGPVIRLLLASQLDRVLWMEMQENHKSWNIIWKGFEQKCKTPILGSVLV